MAYTQNFLFIKNMKKRLYKKLIKAREKLHLLTIVPFRLVENIHIHSPPHQPFYILAVEILTLSKNFIKSKKFVDKKLFPVN